MADVWISGVGMTAFGPQLERNLKSLGREAVETALADSGVEADEIQAVFFANSLAGLVTGQEAIRGETVLHPLGFGTVPIHNVENACASAGDALNLAWMAVASGLYETVLALGAEKLCIEDRARAFAAYSGAMDVEEPFEYEDGAGVSRTAFVDRQARIARMLMEERGVTKLAMAKVASRSQQNGALNPLAHRRRGATPEEVLSSRLVVEPLTVLMCSPVSDGAAAAVLAARPRSERRSIRVRASQLATRPPTDKGPSALAAAGERAYRQAGVSPTEIDFAEVHDASVGYELTAWAELGFCQPGEEQAWAMDGTTELGGRFPVNPSGGLIARGHPIGASGLAQVHEVVMQLRGEAGPRQLARARLALTEIGGGVIRGLTAAAAVHILEAG